MWVKPMPTRPELAASFVCARIMLERGFVISGIRLIKRAWQIYVAHIILFVMYIAEIG
jgi:hypothetical protein